MIKESEVKNVAKFIKDSVEWLKKEDCGCCHRRYDGDLCIVVGWSGGYDEEKDDTIIQSESDPTFAINAGVKLNVSCMQTDMDLDFNYLYWDNGDCWDFTIAISPDEDYEVLARDFLKEVEEMSKYEYDEDGRILGHKNYLELLNAINEDLGSWSDKEDFEIIHTKIEDADIDDEERIELKDKLQEAFDLWSQDQNDEDNE